MRLLRAENTTYFWKHNKTILRIIIIVWLLNNIYRKAEKRIYAMFFILEVHTAPRVLHMKKTQGKQKAASITLNKYRKCIYLKSLIKPRPHTNKSIFISKYTVRCHTPERNFLLLNLTMPFPL